MNHPPQGSYGQPPAGGYPQQGGQYGGHPQQPGGYPLGGWQQGTWQHPGYPGYPGGHGGPQKKSKAGLIIGIMAGIFLLLVVAAVGVVGFWVPGLFLEDENRVRAERTAKSVVTSLARHDTVALNLTACESASLDVEEAIGAVDRVDAAEFSRLFMPFSDQASASVYLTFGETRFEANVGLAKEGGMWCWESLHSTQYPHGLDTVPSDDDSADPEQMVNDLVAAINAGDASSAAALLCDGEDSLAMEEIDRVIADNARLTVRSVDAGELSGSAYIGGTVDGESVDGLITLQPHEGWCAVTASF